MAARFYDFVNALNSYNERDRARKNLTPVYTTGNPVYDIKLQRVYQVIEDSQYTS